MGKPAEKLPSVEVSCQRQDDGWKLLLLVSSDKLSASVQLTRDNPHATCLPAKVVEFVRGAGLKLSRAEDARLPEIARNLVNGKNGAAVVVAKGVAPGKWPEIDWLIPMGISSLRDYSEETIDLHDVSQFINVRARQVLCELPATPKLGSTVFGEAIPPAVCPYQLGDRVALDPKRPARVVATEPGCVRFRDGRLSVEQQLEVSGDLNFKVGNIDFFGDVTIHGSVLDGFHIKSARNVVIDGAVGAAIIEAGGTITIKGGVNGAHKGKLLCGGSLQARYLHMVQVECEGDATIEVECHDSTVESSGGVTVSRGGIVGGRVQAGLDVSAGFIGAEMCVPTLVRAGHVPGLDMQTEKARKALAGARALVKNLESALAGSFNQPGVSSRFPSQRKTQLIQLQTRLADARAALRRAQSDLFDRARGASLAGASISSAKQIYPKVTLVIDSVYEEEVTTEIRGSVRLAVDRESLTVLPVGDRR